MAGPENPGKEDAADAQPGRAWYAAVTGACKIPSWDFTGTQRTYPLKIDDWKMKIPFKHGSFFNGIRSFSRA